MAEPASVAPWGEGHPPLGRVWQRALGSTDVVANRLGARGVVRGRRDAPQRGGLPSALVSLLKPAEGVQRRRASPGLRLRPITPARPAAPEGDGGLGRASERG